MHVACGGVCFFFGFYLFPSAERLGVCILLIRDIIALVVIVGLL
jgi:hypothetical protein